MSMRSMTGFGRGTARQEGWEVSVQVSSVNRKSLEISLSLPREWQLAEPELAAIVREKAARGRLQVVVEARGATLAGMTWDEAAVTATLDRLAALAKARGVLFNTTPELLFQVALASRSEGMALPLEQALPLIREALGAALAEFAAMRAKEGEALERDMAERIRTLSGLLAAIEKRAPQTVGNYRETLLQRLRQAGLEIDLDDERVLKEIALFADRIDIAEELTRLHSHLEQFRSLLAAVEPVGRKAEFILQEMGREIHTVGSKANDLEIARVVIEFKNELERIREQAQNVE